MRLGHPGDAAGAGRRRRRRCSARPGRRWRSGRRNRRGSRGRWSGSTWTSRSSTTPTTRPSMRPIAITSSSAAPATASSCASASARPGASPTAPARWKALDVFTTKAAERSRQCLRAWRRLAHGAGRELRLRGRDVRQCRRPPRGARFQQRARDRRRSDGDGGAGAHAAWPGSTATPRASAGIPSGSTSAAIRPAGTSPACC